MRRAALLLATLLALAACGGEPLSRSAARSDPAHGAPRESTVPGSPASGTGAATTPAPGSTTPGSRRGTATASGAPATNGVARVDRACVHRGAAEELQGLTVLTVPGATVGYSTAYSDGSNELSNPTYKTGFGAGKADELGRMRAVWPVPPTAPLGVATIHVISTDGTVPPVTFTIVAQGASCG